MGQHTNLYKSKAWHRLRWHQLQAEPLCWMCRQVGRTVAATIVDHKTPHRGDLTLFHDPANLASLCKACHDRHKQRQEVTGTLQGSSEDGMPLDQNHRWYRE
jgi:5-methylcytosine-specific restriction protein A